MKFPSASGATLAGAGLIAVGLVAPPWACGGISNTTTVKPGCVPGQSIACVAATGCSGAQTCNTDGGYDPCVCAGGNDAGPDSMTSGMDSGPDGTVPDGSTMETGSPDAADASVSCPDGGTPPLSTAQYLSDPAPIQMTTATGYVLHKELNAYPNYGVTDGAADILYSGQVGRWTFPIPAGNVKSALVVVSVVANDPDAGNYPASDYDFRIWSSGCVFDSIGQLPHGMPFDSRFTNWLQLSYFAAPIPNTDYFVTMANTTMLPLTEWIGIDWIEVRVTTQ